MAIGEFYTYLRSFDELTTPQIRATPSTVDAVVWTRVQLSYDPAREPVLTN